MYLLSCIFYVYGLALRHLAAFDKIMQVGIQNIAQQRMQRIKGNIIQKGKTACSSEAVFMSWHLGLSFTLFSENEKLM